jgi:hypothetical protein
MLLSSLAYEATAILHNLGLYSTCCRSSIYRALRMRYHRGLYVFEGIRGCQEYSLLRAVFFHMMSHLSDPSAGFSR